MIAIVKSATHCASVAVAAHAPPHGRMRGGQAATGVRVRLCLTLATRNPKKRLTARFGRQRVLKPLDRHDNAVAGLGVKSRQFGAFVDKLCTDPISPVPHRRVRG